jgi:hypothetical protein
MKFGYTSVQRDALKKLKIVNKAIGKYKFAWFPITAANGQTIWFEKYYEVSSEFVAIGEDGTYRIDAYCGCDKYAFFNIRDVRWSMYEIYNTKFAAWNSNDYKLVQGSTDILEKLLGVKADLLALING